MIPAINDQKEAYAHHRVSCVIPVYNGERFLGEALESVLAQSYPVDEILVVDDGSTDGTKALVKAYIAKSTQRIRYLWQENAGPAAARNYGVQAASGEFIAFLDVDDLWHPEKTARQLARFAARSELGISVTHIQNVWLRELGNERERMRDHPRSQPVAGYVMQTTMVRRRVFDQIGLLNANLLFADSTEWFLRAQEGKIIDELLPDVLVHRRLHLHNHSRIRAQDSRVEYANLLRMTTHKRPTFMTPQSKLEG